MYLNLYIYANISLARTPISVLDSINMNKFKSITQFHPSTVEVPAL